MATETHAHAQLTLATHTCRYTPTHTHTHSNNTPFDDVNITQEAKKGTASALSATQNTDLAALQAKVVNYEGKIRTLVETVKSERAAFQKQLAEARAHGSQGGGGGGVAAAAARDGSLGAPAIGA